MNKKKPLPTRKEFPQRPASPELKSGSPERKWLWLAGILALTFVAFFPSLKNGLVFWDDPEYVTNNPYTKTFHLREIFTAYFMGNYHPLTLVSFCIEYLLFGMNTMMFHLDNVLLHLVNTALVFVFVDRIFTGKKMVYPVIAAALFGLHPMHVESVSWVSERKDVLYTLFYLLSMISYVKYIRMQRKLSWLALTFILSLLSLLSKGQAVTLPVVFLLIDYLLEKKITGRMLLEKIPFLVMSAVFGYLAIKAQGAAEAVNEQYSSGAKGLVFGLCGLSMYIIKFFLPVRLSGHYPYPLTDELGVPGYVYTSVLVVPLILYLVYRTYKTEKITAFGLMFFVIVIAPMLKFFPVGDAILAERYTYISYLGLSLVAGSWYEQLVSRKRTKPRVLLVNSAGILVLLVLSVLTFQRTRVWKNSYSFWGNVIQQFPDYWRGNHCLGKAYYDDGNYEKANEYFTRAINRDKHCTPIPFLWRGSMVRDKFNRPLEAIPDLKKAMQMTDPPSDVYRDAVMGTGLAFYRAGMPDSAISYYKQMLPEWSDNYQLHHNFALALSDLQQYDSAVAEYNRSLAINPDIAETWLNRGVMYTDKMERYDDGIRDFNKVLELDPGRKEAKVNIGIALYKKGLLDEAIHHYASLIADNPGDGNLYYLRALAYSQKKDFQNAVKDGEESMRLGNHTLDEIMKTWRMNLK